MSLKSMSLQAAGLALAGFCYIGSASAVPLLCENPAVNHMYVDTSEVSSCLGAGVGNVNGNAMTDAFLTSDGAGSGLVGIGSGTYTQDGASGTFSLNAALWQSWGEIAVGFKFGTGGYPDQWFVYLLNPQVSSGSWDFINMFDRGGGLSHLQLYGRGQPTSSVPEPGTLALLGVGLLGLGVTRRRKQA